MVKCIWCDADIPSDSKFCPVCSKEQTLKTVKLKSTKAEPSNNTAMDKILKKYKDVINSSKERHYVSMGPLSVNLSVGNIRGVQSGRMIQIVGRESSGKTTLALDIVAQYQKQFPDRYVMWVDYERSWDEHYAKMCGVDVSRVYRLTPDDAEEGYSIVLESIKEGGVRLVVVDSVPTSIPSAETSKTLKDNAKMAGSASIITRFCQHAIPIIDNYDATIIMINQYRKNFSTLSPIEEVPFGGMALMYATSLLIALTRVGRGPESQEVQSVVQKNKTAKPMAKAKFTIDYGQGVNHPACVVNMAKDLGIVELTGAWYKYKEQRAQGISNAVTQLPIEDIANDVIAMVSNVGVEYVE